MNELKQVRTLFGNIFDDLDARVRANKDLHGCLLFREPPSTAHLPNIQMHLLNTSLQIGNRSYTENKYPLEIQAEINTQHMPNIKRVELAELIEEFVFDYLSNKVGLKLVFDREAPNLDANIHRIILRFSGKYDIEQNIVYKE